MGADVKGEERNNFFASGLDIQPEVWYHTDMDTTNHEHEHFPCDCHRPEYAYTDSLCPMCEEMREREREARRNGEHAEPEWAKRTQEDAEREANNQAFADACGSMTREDWDADNDWLASAGWGEM
jgi:hypothetical protein